jgi:hypothetical protein
MPARKKQTQSKRGILVTTTSLGGVANQHERPQFSRSRKSKLAVKRVKKTRKTTSVSSRQKGKKSKKVANKSTSKSKCKCSRR